MVQYSGTVGYLRLFQVQVGVPTGDYAAICTRKDPFPCSNPSSLVFVGHTQYNAFVHMYIGFYNQRAPIPKS